MDIKTFRCEACGKISTALDVEAGAGVFRRGRFYCTPCLPASALSPAAIALGAAAALLLVLVWAVFSLRSRVRAAEAVLERTRREAVAATASLRSDVQVLMSALQEYQANLERSVRERLANLEEDDRMLRARIGGVERMARESIRQAYERAGPSTKAPTPAPAGPPAPPPEPPKEIREPSPAPPPARAELVPPEGLREPPPAPETPPLAPETSPSAAGGASPLSLWSERLKDKDWGIRYSSVHHLSELRDPEADPLIASALADERPAIRAHAARCLGRRLSRAGVPGLIECLDDSDAYVRHCAHGALKAIAGKDLGYPEADTHEGRKPVLALWKAWWESAGKGPG